MTFNPATWYPIALVLSGINALSAGLAIAQREPSHAAVHVVLTVAFGLWARRLRPRPGGSELQASAGALDAVPARFAALEGEVAKLRHELTEAQERLDFVERLLAQARETPRVGPQR
jgi:hypothetical protein